MKRKTKQVLAMSLAAVFCIGILAACSSTKDDQSAESTPDPERSAEDLDSTETEDPSGSQDTSEEEGYTAGMILEVMEEEVAVQLYTPKDELAGQTITDASDFVLEDYTLSEDVESLSADEPALLEVIGDGEDALSSLEPGGTILLRWDPEDGTLAEVILLSDDAAQDGKAAQVAAVGDGTLEVSWYLAGSDAAAISSYLSPDLTGWTLDSSTETLTLGADPAVYRVQDGVLTATAQEDILEGDTAILSTDDAGEVMQIILLERQDT